MNVNLLHFLHRRFKLISIVLVALSVFDSCSVDQPVASERDSIVFRATVPTATKAVQTTSANLSSFKVTAIGNGESYFTDLDVTVDGSGICTAAKAYYWPAYELGFYAYANTSGGTASIANAAKGIAGVTPVVAAADQKDFVVAYKTGTKANDMASGVALNFRHALSQVVVKAKNLSTSGLKINVKGVKVANVKSSGDFTFPAAVTDPHDGGTLDFALWNSSAASKGAYTIGGASETAVVLDGTAKDIMFSGASWMLIPQQLVAWDLANDKANANNNAFIGVYVQILDAADNQLYPATAGEYAYANVPVDTKWEPGKKYTYTLNFLDETVGGGAGVDDNGDPVLGKPISFTLTVDEWDSQQIHMVDYAGIKVQFMANDGDGFTELFDKSPYIFNGNHIECAIMTLDTYSIELQDVPETVIPSSNFTLEKTTISLMDPFFTIDLNSSATDGLDYGVDYRGPDLLVKDSEGGTVFEIQLGTRLIRTGVFGNFIISPGPLAFENNDYILKDYWNYDSYGFDYVFDYYTHSSSKQYGAVNGSIFFSYGDLSLLFGGLQGVVSFSQLNWRIPSYDDWKYLFDKSRSGSTVNGETNKHWAYIQLANVVHAGNNTPLGVLLFPDGLNMTGRNLLYYDNSLQDTYAILQDGFVNSSFTEGVTLEELDRYIDQGCVFIPASGNYGFDSAGGGGYGGMGFGYENGGIEIIYWTSTREYPGYSGNMDCTCHLNYGEAGLIGHSSVNYTLAPVRLIHRL